MHLPCLACAQRFTIARLSMRLDAALHTQTHLAAAGLAGANKLDAQLRDFVHSLTNAADPPVLSKSQLR